MPPTSWHNTAGAGNSSASATSSTTLRTQLVAIDGEIAALEEQLTRLSTARKNIIDALNAVPYPILTLPTEITAQIFVHYVWTEAGRGKARTLAAVCKLWRKIALSLPKMWSQVVSGPGCTDEFIELWLQRAGTSSLDVEITDGTSHSVFSAIVALSDRWSSFECTLDDEDLLPVDEIHGKIPRLASLILRFVNGPTSEQVTAFADAAHLRSVHTGYFEASWIVLPWTQLIDFSCDVGDTPELIEVLELMPNLETLSLAVTDVGAYSQPSSSRVRLARLRSLEIANRHGLELPFFESLTVPGLEHLKLACLPSSDLDTLLGMLKRSRCSLISLGLETITAINALAIVQATPTVVDLSIAHLLGLDGLGMMLFVMGSPRTLPNLQKLRIEAPTVLAYHHILLFLSEKFGSAKDGPVPMLKEFQYTAPAWLTDEIEAESKGGIEQVIADIQRVADQSDCDITIHGPQMPSIRSSKVSELI